MYMYMMYLLTNAVPTIQREILMDSDFVLFLLVALIHIVWLWKQVRNCVVLCSWITYALIVLCHGE